MTRFEEVARLITIVPPTGIIQIAYTKDLIDAAPWLLEVAGCFQLGYAALLKEIVWAMDTYFQDSHYRPHKIAMGELVKAAEIMEELE